MKKNTKPNLKNENYAHDPKLPVSERYLLNFLLDNVPEYFYFKDDQSRFIRLSSSLAHSFGLNDPAEAIGKTDADYFSAEHARLAFENEQEIIRTGKTLSIEEKETWADQPDTWVLTTKMPMFNEEGKIVGTFGISRDITARKISEENLRQQASRLQDQIEEINLLQEQLQDQAIHDTLTGLYNRRMMEMMLAHQLTLCQQTKQTFSLVIIDIDEFKKINDEYGHQVGDTLLEEFGKCILASTRADDFSCRYGGDEILMAFQKMSIKQAIRKADLIRQRLGEIVIHHEDRSISVTVSIGIATSPIHGKTIEELIKKADEALYAAKEKGRNQVFLADVEKTVKKNPA